jgi:hypothetical protein
VLINFVVHMGLAASSDISPGLWRFDWIKQITVSLMLADMHPP